MTTRQLHLATIIKNRMVEALRHRYPKTYKDLFTFRVDRWRTGGSVDVVWFDGPTAYEVHAVLRPIIDDTSLSISIQRNFSLSFLIHVATMYCAAKDCALPTITQWSDGSAHLDIDAAPFLCLEVNKEASEIDGKDIEDFAYRVEDNGTIMRTSLVLKKDYSGGVAGNYAVIGMQGYALMSGVNVRFDIFKVVHRIGPHRVKVVHGSGRGDYFNSLKSAIGAAKQLNETGKLQMLHTDGEWHY